MEERLIKTGLVFFRYNENITFVMEHSLCLAFLHWITIAVDVHVALCELSAFGIFRVFQGATECDHDLHIIIVVVEEVFLDGMVVANSSQSGCSDHHHLPATADFFLGDVPEGLDNNSCLLLQVMRM